MAKSLAGVVAVSMAALLFAGCGSREESSTQSTVKTTQSTAKQSLPSGFKSVEELVSDYKKLCDYASDLEDTVSEFKTELRAAGAYIPRAPFLSSRSCLGF